MAKSQPSQQTVTQVQQNPPWVNNAAKENLAMATDIANSYAKPYTGPMVAGPNGDHTAAYDMTRQVAGSGVPGIQQAQDTLGRVQNFNPSQVNAQNVQAGSFLNGNLQGYMNPYLAEVENNALGNIDRARKSSLNQSADQAIASRAFGGSRHGVVEGVTNAESARQAGEMSSAIRTQGFNTAAQLMGQDQNRDLTAQQSNQQANLAAQTSNQQAGNDAAKTQALAASQGVQAGQALQETGLQGAAALQNIAEAQKQQDQAYLGEYMTQYDALRNYDLERLGIRMNALGMTPYGKIGQTTGPAQTQGSNPAMGALGGAMSGSSLASTLGFSKGAGAGIGALLGLLSDKSMKTDITKLGKDPESGLDMYAYRYKGDPKNYPKIVGPMAQDVEKASPANVRKIGGKRVITPKPFLGSMQRPGGK
jgi:hypothetical protein